MRAIRMIVVSSAMFAVGLCAPAGAAVIVGPGAVPMGGGEFAGCDPTPPDNPCSYIQTFWEREGTGSLAWHDAPSVITRFRLSMHQAGRIGIRTYRQIDDQPTFAIVAASGLIPAPDQAILDVPTRLALPTGGMIGVALYDHAGPWLDYTHYDPNVGHGNLLTTDSDGPGTVTNLQSVSDDRLVFDATVEPDGDGDGFGDETQDGCPAVSGSEAGCPPSATETPAPATGEPGAGTPMAAPPGGPLASKRPAPLLTGVRLTGRRLTYRLARRVRGRLFKQVRSGGHWRSRASCPLDGRPGSHLAILPFAAGRHQRLVLELRSAGGRIVARRVVRPVGG
jgi:hypothetical protein